MLLLVHGCYAWPRCYPSLSSSLFCLLFLLPPLFTPLLEALGPRSRLIHGTQTLTWLDKKISLKLSKPWNELHQHSEANRPRERKVEFWRIGSGAIFAPSNSTQRVRSCRQRQLDGRCTALLGRFLAAEILPARAFVSLKLPQLFSGDASIHIWPLLPWKILWQRKNVKR